MYGRKHPFSFAASAYSLTQGLRCSNIGLVEVENRLAMDLRMLAGGSYLDVAGRFGDPNITVFSIMWEVIDAINSTPEVDLFFFPQTVAECRRNAAIFKVM